MNKQQLDAIAGSGIAYSFKETIYNSYMLAAEAIKKNIPGAFVECGVAAGGQLLAMQQANIDSGNIVLRPVFGFDSFQGIPLAGANDKTQPGIEGEIKHDVNLPIAERLVSSGVTVHSQEEVEANFKRMNLATSNVKLIKGWFQNTLPLAEEAGVKKIAVLRLDGDLYESTIVCLEYLYPKVVKGGVVIIDDYALDGCKLAVDEYLKKHNLAPFIQPADPNNKENGVVYFEKMEDAIGDYSTTTAAQPSAPKVGTPSKSHSQNNEQDIIIGHFGNHAGTFLDIGANDGLTLSNTFGLLEIGWKGFAVEPSPKAYERLLKNCKPYIDDVKLLHGQFAIGNTDGEITLNESSGFDNGPDVGLLSCIDDKEMERWAGKVSFDKVIVPMFTYKTFIEMIRSRTPDAKFDFINIDAEGMDYEILKQIDLNDAGCKCFCIEHNSIPDMMHKFRVYAKEFGFNEIGFNPENLIFGR